MERLFSLAAAAAALGVGAWALYRSPKRSRSGIVLALGMILMGMEALLSGLSASTSLLPDLLAWQRWRLVVLALFPGCWLYFCLTYARGNASECVARWRTVLLGAFVLPLALLALAWNDMLGDEAGMGPNSMWMLSLERSGVLLHIFLAAGAILALMNLESTLRASRGVMRWRIKYMIVGVGVLLTVWCYASIQAVLYSAINIDLAGLNAGALLLGCLFISVALIRGHLGSVDLYPSLRGLQGSLTLIASGTYLLLVGVLAELAARLQAGSYFPLQAFLALVGIGAVASVFLSDRLRQRAKRFINHYFNRPQYDYRRVWSTFTERTASISDPSDFCREVTSLVSETLEALSVTIWLVDEHRQSFSLGASTSFSEEESRGLVGEGKISPEVVKVLREHAYPTAVMDVSGELGELMRQLGQKKFENGGDYYFLPLATRDEVLGILILGDRVSGLPFTFEEFDLMKTLGNQIVATLLSIKLTGRLGEARKLEAFQTMSTFFVHDLKNTASTLSLMLQNLPRHFDDPDFRQDALRAISKSVDKINAMISRLGYFRQSLELKLAPTDLNDLVTSTLAGLTGSGTGTLTTAFNPLPRLMIDSGQIQKVITNLVLNARDASGTAGAIVVRTESREGAGVMSVSDNGCGMTPEFMDKSLFRPFQTTKQDGFGIGLFHSKMIIEAHHGKIEVDSRPGGGTTFRVILPMTGETS